ncbi:transcription-repair coupling factor [Mangrovibacterium diazotrophicum]|uniref:Transcription-repair-coupling factor n=1 Tax=Mangrovibacterium diazotrophicum TaxID=1261403 RepID=A0A419WBK7_9BACT|nr:transcription-repair coupling factor [Mangrovibacterium diazotrophicum]RKD92855.1 transcription-repair coupling factor [Mangrovibacterium diazotrophicum]
MDLLEFRKIYQNHDAFKHALTSIATPKSKVHLHGLVGSLKSIFASILAEQQQQVTICILNDREEAAYFFDDLNNLQTGENVLFFPSSYKRAIQSEHLEQENIILRTEVLNQIREGNPVNIVTYPEALVEKVITGEALASNSFTVNKGDKLSIDFLNDVLFEYGFERVDFVFEPGQYSIRGSLVDIYSFSNEDPYRLDFFGDDVDSIRSFDIESQISKKQLSKIVIIPNIQSGLDDERRDNFLCFIPENSILYFNDLDLITELIENSYKQALQGDDVPEDLPNRIISGPDFKKKALQFSLIATGNRTGFDATPVIEFNSAPQPVFNKNFQLLAKNMQQNLANGYKNYILSTSEKQIERLHAIFNDQGLNVKFTDFSFTLHEGFVDHDTKIACYTDHQIFERYHRFKIKTRKDQRESITVKELNKLHPGDYVVHIDHGIGKFAGLVKTEVNGKMQEAIRLTYRDNDVLLVSIHSLHRISKYKGKEGLEPKINKLGGGAWQKLKERTKSKVKDIARDLIKLYAKRRQEKGHAFTPDSYLQNELEASFIFEDTPDQVKTTQAVKEDMERHIPMDRLVCGDVGFGKTEIAVRAAFKAATDSKQVAVLVPTTILALQHYKTFSDRLKDFPVKVEYISRLRPAAEIKRILKDVTDGKVDILIGTHRLVGKDVKFKDLGLLIVDEEQKFGVSVKEKLKQLKVNVDTLTLTATPIPRTLQFSLMGARDLSIIQTPPPNRYPIITELHGFNEDLIRDAINYELARNGQAFFIHNRVQNIYEVEATIRRIVPGVKTVVGHGQMEGPKLEKIMLDFINGEQDVLIATTIIESGLDIPNANTIIINHAENFGLSDLHQLRGRVGRSNKKAFCYLLTPPLSMVSTEARHRLQAIEEFSELGSGFNIAMRDLDIRGAGDLLGAEQSGFIADIGYETYHRILNEAIQELKQTEYKDLFEEEQQADASKAFLKNKFISDCQIDTDMELLFPDAYIQSISERMLLYRELDSMETEENLQQFEISLTDRFGKLPAPSVELLEVVRLRWVAINLGIERIILKNKKMICYFISDQQSPYYQSEAFTRVLSYVQHNPNKCRMKEKLNKLSLSFENISTVAKAKTVLSEI